MRAGSKKSILLGIFFLSSASALAVVDEAPRPNDCAHCVPSPSPICPECEALLEASVIEARETTQEQMQRYLKDTLKSIEGMRGESGLVKDRVDVLPDGTTTDAEPHAAPSNIALDLLLQLELGDEKKVDQILSRLKSLEHHEPSGLFFRLYDVDRASKAVNKDISSVDNLHLALALWTASRKAPTAALKQQADALFKRMNMSEFLDQEKGLIHGNKSYKYGKWEMDYYHFGDFGSEVRSIYALGYALDLFKGKMNEKQMKASLKALNFEKAKTPEGPIMRTWDGGGFQLLLPDLLLNESKYSKELRSSFDSYSKYIVNEGKRLGYSLPAVFSACAQADIGRKDFKEVFAYNGRMGHPPLVSSNNKNFQYEDQRKFWDKNVATHPLIMAATRDPERFAPLLSAAEKLGEPGSKLYREGHGWMDSIHVKSPDKGKVVPATLSLDQSMIALSLISKLRAQDQRSVSARALGEDPEVRKRLETFYKLVDTRLKNTPAK